VVAVKAFTKLVASIKNPSEFNLTAINVTFEVNGKYVGSKIVNISRNSTENVTFQWVSGNLPTGIYTVTISINSRIVQLQNGNSYTFKIQSGNPFTIYMICGRDGGCYSQIVSGDKHDGRIISENLLNAHGVVER
jgi:hypothetical protein